MMIPRVEVLDVVEIHPTFDCETKTWFAKGFEAKSISELLDKLQTRTGKKHKAIDHYVDCRCPEVKYPAMTMAEILKRPGSPAMHKVGRKPNPKPVYTGDAVLPDLPQARAVPRTRPVSVPRTERYSHTPIPGMRTANSFTGDEYAAIINQVLDLWATGMSGPAIAERLNLKADFVGAHIIPKARQRGDKRAARRMGVVVRNRNF